MKLVKSASGKKTVKMSKSEWEGIGRKAGWMKKRAGDNGIKFLGTSEDVQKCISSRIDKFKKSMQYLREIVKDEKLLEEYEKMQIPIEKEIESITVKTFNAVREFCSNESLWEKKKDGDGGYYMNHGIPNSLYIINRYVSEKVGREYDSFKNVMEYIFQNKLIEYPESYNEDDCHYYRGNQEPYSDYFLGDYN